MRVSCWGLGDSAAVQTPQDPQFRKTSWSLFAQDTWKVTRKLTFTYGVRWDRQGAADEIHQRLAEFSPTTMNPTVGLLGATIYEGNGAGRCNCSFTNSITRRSARGLASPTSGGAVPYVDARCL